MARVERTIADATTEETNFYTGFLGGYWVTPHVLAGLEVSGWLLQSGNLRDPSVGEGISRIFLSAQLYPSADCGWFIKAGGGYASYWNNRPGEPTDLSGNGFELGTGHDFVITAGRRWVITPFASYSSGEIGDEEHTGTTAGVGLSCEF